MAENLDMTGKFVIVTGGGRGVGRGISECFLDAGADAVVMSSPDKATIIRRVDAERPLDELLEALGPGFDIVLVEGYKVSPAAKILVLPEGEAAPDDADLSRVLATVVPEVGPDGVPQFSPDVVRGLVELMESAAADGRASYTAARASGTS